MKITRRTLVLGAMSAPLAAPFTAQAQTWPSGIIRIVVPFHRAARSMPITRMVQPAMQERSRRPSSSKTARRLRQRRHRPVAKSAPDGNTWLVVFDTHAANPFVLNLNLRHRQKDLDPVMLIGTAPYLMATHPSRPYKSFADVIAAAKAKPDTISYASVGSGSVGHLAMALLARPRRLKLVHVPYRGGGPAMNDALGGHVDLLIGSTALSMPQVNTGKTCVRDRADRQGTQYVPRQTCRPSIESGFPGFEAYAWWGIFAPAGTPKPIIERFGKEMAASLRDERSSKQLIETLQVTLTLGGPEVLRKFVAGQMEVWGKVVKDNNIKRTSGRWRCLVGSMLTRRSVSLDPHCRRQALRCPRRQAHRRPPRCKARAFTAPSSARFR